MKRRSFLAGLFTAPFVKGTLPADLLTPVVEETVPLSKTHWPMMVTGGGGEYRPTPKRTNPFPGPFPFPIYPGVIDDGI